ncbi:ABC transporter permease [Clostridium sp. OS1-26]|uniref:ABC transporter permease n=1 Tax=Clostridium sp. OS1-26 TaxID=3070681 RepID=UPI0027E108D7|nr:ABC transporter permease [Clostridium sp. OS1-26]WML36776.1 ABC transporter permease [Clostridium sp. OS1-26]
MNEKVLKFIRLGKKAKNLFFSFLFVLGIPIICSFVLGYQMKQHQVQHIPTIVVDHDNSQFSKMLINEIKTNEIFNVTNYSDRDEDVKDLMGQEKVRVGVIIPKDFSKDLVNGNAPKVLIFYDGSQMAVSSAAKARMSEILLSIKTGYLEKLVQGKLGKMPEVSRDYVLPMYFNYRVLNNPTRNYINFLIPGMIISLIQVSLVMMGVDIVKEDEKNYLWLWIKGILGGLLGVISIGISLAIQFKYFAVPFRGTFNGAAILTVLYSIGLVNYGVLIRLILPEKVLALQVASIPILLTTILAGFTFPLLAMPSYFHKLAEFLPFLHYGEVIRDLCLKDIGISYILPQINWMIKFVLYMWIASFGVFMLKKIVKKKYTSIKSKKDHQQKTEEVVQV